MKNLNLKDESGQAMILTLMCMTILLGFVGLAADIGIMFHTRRNMQIAADSAAIAAAEELSYGDSNAAGNAASVQNGVTNGSNGDTVAINNPPLYGAFAGNINYVEAIVTQKQPTIFASVLSVFSMNVGARAVATMQSNAEGGCLYTLGTTGPDIQVTGNSNISVPDCKIYDDSSSNDALDLTGNINLTAKEIGIVGKADDTGNIDVTPTPVTNIVPVADPLAYLPDPAFTPGSCAKDPDQTGNNNLTLSAGCYNGFTIEGNTVLKLNPGTYIINGTLDIEGNASVTGTGVTLDLLGNTTFIGNTSLNLSAPTSGIYNGILIYQPSSNTDALTITGNSGWTLKGVVYAPSSDVTFTGNSASTIYTGFVSKSLTLTGNSGFNDYASLAGVTNPFTAATLVE